jgi:hypothetical protein
MNQLNYGSLYGTANISDNIALTSRMTGDWKRSESYQLLKALIQQLPEANEENHKIISHNSPIPSQDAN